MQYHIRQKLFDALRTRSLDELNVTSFIKSANISRSTFYRCYDSLDEVFKELVSQSEAFFMVNLPPFITALENPETFFVMFNEAYEMMLSDFYPLYKDNHAFALHVAINSLIRRLYSEDLNLSKAEQIRIRGMLWLLVEQSTNGSMIINSSVLSEIVDEAQKKEFLQKQLTALQDVYDLQENTLLYGNSINDALLKPSKFNHIVQDQNGIIIYNSRYGINSMTRIESNFVSEVKTILSMDKVSSEFIDHVFPELRDGGFLVNYSLDEGSALFRQYMDFVHAGSLFLIITLTSDCNFVCEYCSQDHYPQTMTSETQEGICAFIKKHIRNYTSLHVEWFGGEPLLCLPIIESLSSKIIHICGQAGRSYSAAITTNGYLLSDAIFKALYKNHVTAFQITLDGLQEQHDKQRHLKDGSGTYQRIVGNIKSILSSEKSRNFRITIRINFTKAILSRITSTLQGFSQLFGDDDRVVYFARAAEDWGGDRVKHFGGLLDSNEKANLFNRILASGTDLKFYGNYAMLESMGGVCHAAHKNMFTIGMDGKIYKCDNCNEDVCVGILDQQGNMRLNKAFAEEFSYSGSNSFTTCNACSFCGVCVNGGCPKRNAQKQPAICGFEKRNLDGILKLFSHQFDIRTIGDKKR